MESQKVYVVVTGLQSSEEDYNTTEIMAQGEYYYRGGKHYLRYTEYDDTSHMEEKIMLKVAGDGSYAEMNRQGLANTKLVMEPGKSHTSPYYTPFGQINLTLITQKLEVEVGEREFVLEGEYRLESDGMFITDNQIRVVAKALDVN